MPGLRFLRNVVLFSLVGLLPAVLTYIVLTPGFASVLVQGGPNLQRFVRQILTNGMPVVCAVNYVGFLLYALSKKQDSPLGDPLTFIISDVVARVSLFIGLHALIYVLSADWYGSFGGSRSTALKTVAPTLARSAYFENISGAYFYATLISAVPLYVSVSRRSSKLRAFWVWFPFGSGPLVFVMLTIAAGAVFLTTLSNAAVWLQN